MSEVIVFVNTRYTGGDKQGWLDMLAYRLSELEFEATTIPAEIDWSTLVFHSHPDGDVEISVKAQRTSTRLKEA